MLSPKAILTAASVYGVQFTGGSSNLDITFSPANDLEFTFSTFFYPTGLDVYLFQINPGGTANLQVYLDGAGNVSISGRTTAGIEVLSVGTPAGLVTINEWNHIAVSIDLFDSGKRHIYINGTAVSPTWTTYTDALGPLGWNTQIFRIFPNPDTFQLQNFYLATGQYLELSVASNLQKFIRGNRPVSFGTTGELPTGTQASIALTGTAAEFVTNLGNGGTVSTGGAPLTTTTSRVRVPA